MPTYKTYYKNPVLVGAGTYKYRPYTVLSPTVALNLNLTGCSTAQTHMNRLGQTTITFTKEDNYNWPATVQVTGATLVSWSAGTLMVEKATVDPVVITVTCTVSGYTDCLTFTGKDSDFILTATNKMWDGTIEWSTDHNTWTTLAGTEEMRSVDKKLYLRGKNTCFGTSYGNAHGIKWKLSAKADCNGNIQTLLDWENPPASISIDCYNSMFNGCTNLTAAPELPATTLANNCYYSMFSDCTNLTSAPELPATNLANNCYNVMFSGCTNLTSAPELPATTLEINCYNFMFYGCTNLTTAPVLPATTLEIGCYQAMFQNCSKLKVNTASGSKIFTCPSTIPEGAVNDMFAGTGGTFTGTPTAGSTYYYTE